MKRKAVLFIVMIMVSSLAAAQDLPLIAGDTPVGPRDVLEVRVLEDPTISGQTRVTEEGQIVLEVVGKVDVAGLTPAQIEARLRTILESKFIRKATVSVQVTEFGSKPISVVGAVLRPGRISASNNMTLIQAITQAGGLTQGYGTELYVLRTARNGLTENLAVDIEELLVRGNPDVNIPLAPDDLINVPIDAPISIYVMGEVMKPGKVQFRRSQTPMLMQAIADAGGPTDRAGKWVIIRRIIDGKQTTIRLNYRAISGGDKDDVALRDNDTVVVNESWF